ncbi:hypothetical protein ACS0TY_027195 [Phlomoides rotata]
MQVENARAVVHPDFGLLLLPTPSTASENGFLHGDHELTRQVSNRHHRGDGNDCLRHRGAHRQAAGFPLPLGSGDQEEEGVHAGGGLSQRCHQFSRQVPE